MKRTFVVAHQGKGSIAVSAGTALAAVRKAEHPGLSMHWEETQHGPVSVTALDSKISRYFSLVENVMANNSPWTSMHRGPKQAVCAVCGKTIGPYESRYYGDTGAVHRWIEGTSTTALCRVGREADFPHYYTDG